MSEGHVEGASRQVFSARTAIAIVVVGVFAFSAFVTLLAYAPDLQRDFHCRANVYSKCAVGFAGLEALAKADGAPVLASRTHLPKGHTEGLLIWTLEPDPRQQDVASLGFAGPILIVLPKWEVTRDPLRLEWGRKKGLISADQWRSLVWGDGAAAHRAGVSRPLLRGLPGTPFEGLTLTPGPIDSFQTFDKTSNVVTKGSSAAMLDEAGNPVIVRLPGPPTAPPSAAIYVLTDPDLLNTQGLANVDTMGAGVAILKALRRGDGPIIFDVTLNGYELDRNALKLMFAPPFAAVTMCVAAALALAGLQAAFRFGPLRRQVRAFALGKEALADNSAQLIRLARREPKMAPRYAALTRAAAAKAVGAPRELVGEGLTGFLDRLGRQKGAHDTLAGLTSEAERIRDRTGLTALAQRLFRWRLEMTRERQ
ncbi:MAG: hypothetical protein ACHP7N_17900 [Caulobacterales bacterium]